MMPDFIKACGLSHDSKRKPQRKEELESQVRNGFLHVVASAFGVEGARSWVQDSKNPEQRPAFGVWIREAELCFLAPPLLAVRDFLNLLETRLSSLSGDRAWGRVTVRSACVNTCDALSIFNQLWRKIVTRCEVGGRGDKEFARVSEGWTEFMGTWRGAVDLNFFLRLWRVFCPRPVTWKQMSTCA